MQEFKKKNTGISERISYIIEKEGINANIFAKKIGYNRSQTIYDIINSKAAPGFDFFNRFVNSEFSEKYNISWLISGRIPVYQNSYANSTSIIQEPKTKYNPSPIKGIPLIPITKYAYLFESEIQTLDCICERYDIPILNDADFLIQTRGNAMQPTYNGGDILACKKLPTDPCFFQWNKAYVIDTDQGVLTRRIRKGHSQDTILIVSDNPNYESFELSLNEIHHIALVIGAIRLE